MKALVTGGTGFVGSHVVSRLLSEGVEVRCLVRSTSSLSWLQGLPVETHICGLEDAEELGAAVKGVDYIFHVAGITRARGARAYRAVNVAGTERIVQAALRLGDKLRRFVYVSSLAAVGPASSAIPPDEKTEPRPLDHYGSSKLEAERVVLGCADRMPVSVVRPPAVYGPRDVNLLPVFRFAGRSRLFGVPGGTSRIVSLVHASDLARGIWLAASIREANGQVYFVSGGNHTYVEIADAMQAALGMRLTVFRVMPFVARLAGELGEIKWTLTGVPQIMCRRKVRDMLQERWTCSWAKAEKELGYRPLKGIRDGMRETAEWYAENGWIGPIGPPAGSG